MADRVQHRRDTEARWAEVNPVLLEGEIGYVLDNPNQHKIGDGEHAWNDLPLRGFTGNIAQSFGDDENAVVSQKVVTEEKRRAENAEKENSAAIAAEVKRAQSAEELISQQAEQNFKNFSELGVEESAKSDGFEIALTKKTNTAEKTKVKVPVYDMQNPSATPVGLVDEVFVEDMKAEAKTMVDAEAERAQSAEELISQQAEQNFKNFSELGVEESAKGDGYEIALTKKTNTAEKTKVKVPVYDMQNPSATPVGLVDEIFVEDMKAEAKTMVDAEAERAKTAEGEIRGSIESLGEDLNAASEDISKLEDAIEAEKSRAKGAEQALSTEITEAENRVDERVTEVRDSLEAEVQARSAAVADLQANTGISEYPAFDPAVDYAVGDVVVYDGRLKRFTADHAAGEWIGTDAESWSERKEREEIVNSVEVFDTEILEPAEIIKGLFARYDTGELSGNEGYITLKFNIEGGEYYLLSAYMSGALTALPVYMNNEGYVGYDNRTSIATLYYKKKIKAPKTASYIYVSVLSTKISEVKVEKVISEEAINKKLYQAEDNIENLSKITNAIINKRWVDSAKFNPYIQELYISGTYNGVDVKDCGLYIKRLGFSGDQIFIYIYDSEDNNVIYIQTTQADNGYYKAESSNGVTIEVIFYNLKNSLYDWDTSTDVKEKSILNSICFDLDYSPRIAELKSSNSLINVQDRIEKNLSVTDAETSAIAIYTGAWVSNSGELVTVEGGESSQYTDLIPTKAGDRFRFTAGTLYNNPCVWLQYDKDKKVIEYKRDSGNYDEYLTITNPNTAYIRFSSFSGSNIKLSVYREKSDGIKTAGSLIENIYNDYYELSDEALVTIEDDTRISNGVLVEYTEFKSQYYQNTDSFARNFKIKGTSNPYIDRVPLVGFTEETPTIGVELTSIIYSKNKAQEIEQDITLQPGQWAVINGYANDLQLYSAQDYKPKLPSINERIDSIAKEKNKGNVLYGKKYAFCGDSFTEAIFSSLTDEEGRTGKDSPEYWDSERGIWKSYAWHIIDRNNMEFYADGISGSTIGVNYNEDGTVNNSRKPFAYQRYLDVPSDCDYITLMFGLNEGSREAGTKDSTDDSTIWGAYNKVLEHLLTVNPYAKIGIIIPDAWLSQTQYDTQIAIAEYWGIPYLDLRGGDNIPLMIGGKLGKEISGKAKSLRNAAFQMSSSDSHPNPKAHAYRSTVIENWLRSL